MSAPPPMEASFLNGIRNRPGSNPVHSTPQDARSKTEQTVSLDEWNKVTSQLVSVTENVMI